MNSKKKMMMGLAMALGAMSLATGTARAAQIIDFNLGLSGGGGTVSYAGGSAPLVGTNVQVGAVHAVGADKNGGTTLVITGSCGGFGCLNFTTGVGNGTTFGPGGVGSFTITGTIAGIPALSVGTFTLLSGDGAFASVSQTAGGAVYNFHVDGSDIKNPNLVSFYFNNVPPSWVFTGSLEGINPVAGERGGYSTTIDSLDINNIATPEPMSVFLLGTAMVGIATVIRRRKKNQVTL